MALIPYRESKLTILLRDALGGSGYTLMVACLNMLDSSVEENLSTLQYACTAGRIRNCPVVNLDPTSLLIKQLRQEIQGLKRQLEVFQKYVLHVTGKPIPMQVLNGSLLQNLQNADAVQCVAPPSSLDEWGAACLPGAHPGQSNSERQFSNQSHWKPATPRSKVKATTPPLALSREPPVPPVPVAAEDTRSSVPLRSQAEDPCGAQDETLGISKEELAERLSEAIATLRQATTENLTLRRKCDAAQLEKEALQLKVGSLEKEMLLHRHTSRLGNDAWCEATLDSFMQSPDSSGETTALAAMPRPEACTTCR